MSSEKPFFVEHRTQTVSAITPATGATRQKATRPYISPTSGRFPFLFLSLAISFFTARRDALPASVGSDCDAVTDRRRSAKRSRGLRDPDPVDPCRPARTQRTILASCANAEADFVPRTSARVAQFCCYCLFCFFFTLQVRCLLTFYALPLERVTPGEVIHVSRE